MLHLARYSSITPSDFERALGISVGFDSLFDRFLGEVESSASATGYPPSNIHKDEENIYSIEMAVSGFSNEDLEAEFKECILTVRSKQDQDDGEYLHRGIAKRAFSRSFTLSDDVVIKGADLINGMLTISLERIIPEEKKSRMIEIGEPTESALKKIN